MGTYMTKVALIADIHYHLWSAFSPDGGRSRLKDISNVVRQVLSHCITNDIHHVAILGDVFEKRGTIDSVVYNVFAEDMKAFLNAGIKVYILAGNHDQDLISNDGWSNSLEPLSGLYGGLKIVSSPEVVHIEGTPILFLPYIHDHQKVAAEINAFNININFIHAGILGAKMTDSDFRIKSGLDLAAVPNAAAIYSGHYHTPQTLGIATYIGSPLHHTFNDGGQQKSFLVLDVEANTFERVNTVYPAFKRVEISDINYINKIKSDDFYRLHVQEQLLSEANHEHLRLNTRAYEVVYSFKAETENYYAKFDSETQVLRKFIQREFTKDHRQLFQEAKKYLC